MMSYSCSSVLDGPFPIGVDMVSPYRRSALRFIGGVANDINRESQRQETITYQVEGSGQSVAVTYSGNDFNTAQEVKRQVFHANGPHACVIIVGT
jgi:hypothetical protein